VFLLAKRGLKLIGRRQGGVLHHGRSKPVKGMLLPFYREQRDLIRLSILCHPAGRILMFPAVDLLSKLKKLKDKMRFIGSALIPATHRRGA